jgi:hypothetical protein
LRLLNRNDFEIQFKISITKILEIRLLEFLFKIHFGIEIKFKLDFETKDIFQKWKAMILEKPRRSVGFEIESNMDSNKSRRFLLTLLNLKQYIITKINEWWHE